MYQYLRIAAYILSGIIIGVFVSRLVTYKIDSLKKDPANLSIITAKERERQLNCLAQNIYHEAKGEPFEGKVAVAQVTINRSESGQFPKDICAVVFQKNIVMEKLVCQFSWYCQHVGNPPIKSPEHFKESYEVAKKVLLEDFRLDSLKEAMYFHAVYVNPNWKKERVAKIGNHIFYK